MVVIGRLVPNVQAYQNFE